VSTLESTVSDEVPPSKTTAQKGPEIAKIAIEETIALRSESTMRTAISLRSM
jgi:hypothetical protein